MEGTVLLSVNRADKAEVAEVVQDLVDAGFQLMATGKTYETIRDAGFSVNKINKMYEGRPNIYDAIINREVQFVINTPIGNDSEYDDSYIRKAAIKAKIPYMTTMAAAKAAAKGIKVVKQHQNKKVQSLQELHQMVK